VPIHVLVVHNDADYAERIRAALADDQCEVRVFGDPMTALDLLDTQDPVDVLVTRIQFGDRKPHGVSLAQVSRRKRPAIKVVFVARPELEEHTLGLGVFVPASSPVSKVSQAIRRVLDGPDLE
jgi:DNA-binding NtrC family response regulator